jgi:hypothetical protein
VCHYLGTVSIGSTPVASTDQAQRRSAKAGSCAVRVIEADLGAPRISNLGP